MGEAFMGFHVHTELYGLLAGWGLGLGRLGRLRSWILLQSSQKKRPIPYTVDFSIEKIRHNLPQIQEMGDLRPISEMAISMGSPG